MEKKSALLDVINGNSNKKYYPEEDGGRPELKVRHIQGKVVLVVCTCALIDIGNTIIISLILIIVESQQYKH